MRKDHVHRSFRLSPLAAFLLKSLAQMRGTSEVAQIEEAIRDRATAFGVEVQDASAPQAD